MLISNLQLIAFHDNKKITKGRYTSRKHGIVVGTWNVRALFHRDESNNPEWWTDIITKEFYACTLKNSWVSEDGQLIDVGEWCTFFWKGNLKRVRLTNQLKHLGICSRTMCLRVPLPWSPFLSIPSMYLSIVAKKQ